MVKSNQTGRIKAFGLKVNGKDIGADDHWSPKVLCGKIGPKAKGKSSKFLFRINQNELFSREDRREKLFTYDLVTRPVMPVHTVTTAPPKLQFRNFALNVRVKKEKQNRDKSEDK